MGTPPDIQALQQTVESAWEHRAGLTAGTTGTVADAVNEALDLLDHGVLRVAEKIDDAWQVNEWLKKAVLLSFRLNGETLMEGGPDRDGRWWDKVPLKFAHWSEEDFRVAGFRVVPGTVVRRSAYVAPGAVLMPCFVNVGARVGEGTMIDTWCTVGSCAQIGKNVHISGGVGIGGVLEPLQAAPVIIEDNCFIGARAEIAEGVIVEEGAVIAMGVYISASTRIVDRETGEVMRGRVPAYSVVVPGSVRDKKNPDISLAAAIIVKKVDAQTRAKTSINELLRS